MNNKDIRVHIDTTSNALKIPRVKEQIENQLKKRFENLVPEAIKRMEQIPTLLTHEVGLYSKLLNEAKTCYAYGFYYSTISLIGIAAESFCKELESKINFKINQVEVGLEYLFKDLKQTKRLDLLKAARLINEPTFKRLEEIKLIRNNYVHPKKIDNIMEDSLKILKLFIDHLNSRFSEIYEIKNGKLVERKTNSNQ